MLLSLRHAKLHEQHINVILFITRLQFECIFNDGLLIRE